MLELRIVEEHDLVPTANEKSTPPLLGVKVCELNNIILTDVCFNDSNGTFLKWKRNLTLSDVAVIVYNKIGRLETLFVFGKRVGDEELIALYLKRLLTCYMTCYNMDNGKSIILFYIPYKRRDKFKKGNINGSKRTTD